MYALGGKLRRLAHINQNRFTFFQSFGSGLWADFLRRHGFLRYQNYIIDI